MAKVNFKRINSSNDINNIPIVDGSFIATGDGKSYVDFGSNRIPIGGTPDNTMSDSSSNSVENRVIKQYVDTQVNKLPIYASTEQIIGETSDGKTIYRKQYTGIANGSTQTLEINFTGDLLKEYGYVTNSLNSQIPLGMLVNGQYGSTVYKTSTGELTLSSTSDITRNYSIFVEYIR